MKNFFKHFGTFLFIAEIGAIAIATWVGLVPTNVKAAATIIAFIMAIVAVGCFGEAEKEAETETTYNAGALE